MHSGAPLCVFTIHWLMTNSLPLAANGAQSIQMCPLGATIPIDQQHPRPAFYSLHPLGQLAPPNCCPSMRAAQFGMRNGRQRAAGGPEPK